MCQSSGHDRQSTPWDGVAENRAPVERWIATFVFLGLTGVCFFAGCSSLRSDFTSREDRPTSASDVVAGGLPAPKTDASVAVLEVAFVSVVRHEPGLGGDTLETINPLDSSDPMRDEATLGSESSDLSDVATLAGSKSSASSTGSSRTPDEELWHWIDETAVSPEVRQQLRLNGIRVGRVHTRSEFLRALTAMKRQPIGEPGKLMDAAAVESDLSHLSRRIPCRVGRRYELPVRQPSPGSVPTLVSVNGSTVGRTLASPQPIFAVTVQSSDTAGLRLRLQPEIQFGEMRQTWVGSDSALRIDSRRESWVLEQLALELSLAKGGILVASSTEPPQALGKQMFMGTTADGDTDHVVMVISVASMPEVLAKP